MRSKLSHHGTVVSERWYVAHRCRSLAIRAVVVRKTARRTESLMAYPRFPAPDPCRFLERDERTAMYSKILRRRVNSFEAAHKDASGPRIGPEATFPLDLRPDFQWPPVEVAGKTRDERRRSFGAERGENRILGGSDPTLSGLAAAQRLRRRGSLPPELSSRLPRSVAGRVVGEPVRTSKSHQQQESKHGADSEGRTEAGKEGCLGAS